MSLYSKVFKSCAFFLAVTLAGCSADQNKGSAQLPEEEALNGNTVFVPDGFDGMFPVAFSDQVLVYYSYSRRFLYVKGDIVGDSLVNIQHFVDKAGGLDPMSIAALNLRDSCNFSLISENFGVLGSLTHWVVPADGDFTQARKVYDMPIAPDQRMSATASQFILLEPNVALMFTSPFHDPNTIASIVDYNDDVIKSIKLWPEDDFKGDPAIKASAYDYSPFLATNGKGKFAYATKVGKYMCLFTLNGPDSTVKITKMIYDEKPEYEAMADGLNFTYKNCKPRSIRCASNTKHIYVLHAELNQIGQMPATANDAKHGNRVDVFNWQGDLVRRLVLDQLGEGILVDNHDQALYLTNRDSVTQALTMRRYKL